MGYLFISLNHLQFFSFQHIKPFTFLFSLKQFLAPQQVSRKHRIPRHTDTQCPSPTIFSIRVKVKTSAPTLMHHCLSKPEVSMRVHSQYCTSYEFWKTYSDWLPSRGNMYWNPSRSFPQQVSCFLSVLTFHCLDGSHLSTYLSSIAWLRKFRQLWIKLL